MTKLRKAVSFRIDSLELDDQKIINDWLNKQRNIQLSIPNLLIHAIKRAGNRDVMSYEVQRILHEDIFLTQAAPQIVEVEHTQPVVESKPVEVEHTQPVVESKPVEVEHTQPVVESKPVEVEHTQPVIESKPVEVEHTQPVIESKPVEAVEDVKNDTLIEPLQISVEKTQPAEKPPLVLPSFDDFNKNENNKQ